MEYKEHKIDSVEPGSIAQEMGIEPGDILLAVNGKPVRDVFDYHYLINDALLNVLVRRADGQEWELEIEKDYYEDLGIGFENGLMDDYRSCRNKCIFCFIDQMPPGMRETLYFKDDDSRLSFLQGNYVTLTNMSEEDVERIITYKLAPINISVHTTNPKLRCRMLNNRFAGEALGLIRRFYEAGIEMNGQIVLCRGINDGEEMERSIRELAEFLPFMKSLSVVPVGLTKYREGLYPLEPFTPPEAGEVLRRIHRWQEICFERWGNHFVHAGDEWYLLAGEDFPPEENYDGYVQLENGVGMMRLLQSEFDACLCEERKEPGGFRLYSGGTAGGRGDFLSPGAGETELYSGGTAGGGGDFPSPGAGETELYSGGTAGGRGDFPSPCAGSSGMFCRGRAVKSACRGKRKGKRRISIATGVLAAPLIRRLTEEFVCLHPDREILVYEIENRFFGEGVTVSGLLTGQDIAAQLTGRELGEKLLLPCSLLRSGEEVFLDDMRLTELENALQVPIHIVESDGQCLYEELLG